MENDSKEQKKPKGKHGGARPNSGRKVGGRDMVTIRGLIDQIRTQAGGREYEELLVEDFLSARLDGDKATVIKYHNLILNKVMNSLAKIEVTDSADAIESKKQAFAEALARLTGVNPEE